MPTSAKRGRKSAPASREVISRKLREVIRDDGAPAYALGREAGVDAGMIQRFLNEERDIRLDTLDRLADVLGLRLVEAGRGRARSSRARGGPQRDARGPRETRRDDPAMIDPENANLPEDRP